MQYTRIAIALFTLAACAPPGPTQAPTESGKSEDSNKTTTTASSSSPDQPPPKDENETPKRISARHILIMWMGSERAESSVVRSKEQAYTVAQEVLRRAKAGDDFGRLAAEYSDEPGAGSRGGSLGRFSHGQMVPPFEAAAFRLKVGEISDIVETPFGYHIIQRTE